MPNSTGEEWISISTAARLLGQRYGTVYRLVQRGALPAEIMAPTNWRGYARYRVRRSDVDAFIERSRDQPGELDHLSDG